MTLVLPGEGAQALARGVAQATGSRVGQVEFQTFPDGEDYVHILDPVAGEDVVVVQTTFPPARLWRLLLLLDAAREAGAARVRAVAPYLAYQRQDRVFKPGEALSARVVASAISGLAHECFTFELHRDENRRFFQVPVHNLDADEPVAEAFGRLGVDLVLAPDAGARFRAERVARRVGAAVDHLEKTRLSSTKVEIKPKAIEAKGRRVAILDDIISTGITMSKAIEELLRRGAAKVYAVGIHGLFLGDAIYRLERAGASEILVTDTVESAQSKITVAGVLAKALAAPRVRAR